MTALFRKCKWWLQRRRREDDLRDELRFHLTEEAETRAAGGLTEDEARQAARRELGNVTLVREETRVVWSWILLEQLGQDLRYGLRTIARTPAFTSLVALSLALGIGANAAIYSFMDSMLFRSLPVSDPASLVVLKWRSKPVVFGKATNGSEFVLHSVDGITYDDSDGTTAAIFPFPAFERLQQVSASVFSSMFAYRPAGNLNVLLRGDAELVSGEYVSGGFFRGLEVIPAAGRLISDADDRTGASAVVVISMGYSQRRFGSPADAIGQSIQINNLPFIIVGVAPSGFYGVDPGAAPNLYLPLHTNLLLETATAAEYLDPNYYWLEMMGRLGSGVARAQAQAALAQPFEQWVMSTATNDRERANLPVLRLEDGAGGLDSLRHQYSKPLYVLLAMVGLILALACANTANLLLARASARRREMAVRLSMGAGRGRVIRQLLTESILLASLAGALGIAVGVAGIRVLTELLANGQEGFTLHAELNWHVLLAILALSALCGLVFGLAPALQSASPALMPALKDAGASEKRARLLERIPSMTLTRALVVTQIAISLLLLVVMGLFVRTLANLHAVPLGFNRQNVLLFDVNAPQAGLPAPQALTFYDTVRSRLAEVPGVTGVTLSHASLIRAGRAHPITVSGHATEGTRVLWTGSRFFSTMQISIIRGREITEDDRQGTLPVAVVNERFARTYFGETDPIGRQIEVGGSLQLGGRPRALTIVGVSVNARYGGLKREIPPVVYVSYAQVPASQLGKVTYAMRTDGDPLSYAGVVRTTVHEADARVPVTHIKTQTADIDQTINQEIVFARLCTAFAVLALVIACIGLYGTMAYTVARRTREIGIRMALGAQRAVVAGMVLRDVCVLVVLGLVVGLPIAMATSRVVGSFLFDMKPNDPSTLTFAVAILLGAALLAGYMPARRASRIEPIVALRHE